MVKTQKKNNPELKLDKDEDDGINGLWDDIVGNEKQSRPSYYSVLPANVRYDSQLTHLDKILYSEITALSNVLGYCYATNSWFAEQFSNSERTVSRSINNLLTKEYITTEVESVVDTKRTYRKIFINLNRSELEYVKK